MKHRGSRSIRGATRGVFAAVLASLSVLALSAGTATAAPSCTGAGVVGTGSAAQAIAQNSVWAPTFAAEVCNKGAFPEVAYTPTNSAAGMAEWNYDAELGEINNEFAFIGTDMAPTATQIESIKAVAGGAQVAVIPVAQTAIAMIANPPEGCEIEGLLNGQLSAVFEGRIYSWDQLEGVEPEFEEFCEAPITRVVRKDPSGTTYQFKNYLFQLSKSGLYCTEGGTEGKANWQDLQPVTNPATGTPNTVWPETCAKKALSALVKPSGNGEAEVVSKVNELAGSIAFVALPEAKAGVKGSAVIMTMQNNGQKKGGEANFASPAVGGAANCAAQAYKVPKTGTNIDLDWSQVFGAQPAIGGLNYPLCMLTYALAFKGYNAAGFSEAQEITARDYLYEYVVQAAGQNDISSNYYYALPETGTPTSNILGAAQRAAKEISY